MANVRKIYRPSLLGITLGMVLLVSSSMLGEEVLGTQVHEGSIGIRGNEVMVLEGEHEINGTIYVEENGTLVLRNARINFTQTADYQFQIRLVNPRGGRPRLIIENSEITTPKGYQHEINLYYNSTAEIRGLTTSDGVRIHGFHDSTIQMSDSVIRGLTVYGYGDSRLNISNSSMIGLYAECNTQIHAQGCEVNNTVYTVIRSSNVTIQNLRPGHVKYWSLTGNHSIAFDPEDWKPSVIIENSYLEGFGFHFSKTVNATIDNSHLRMITATSQTQLWIQNSTTDFGLSTRHDSMIHAKDCRFGSSTARENSTLDLTNSTFQNHWLSDGAQKIERWYLSLTIGDPDNQTIPGATITVTHPNQTIVATGVSDPAGQAVFTLLGATANATARYPVGPYAITASHHDHQTATDIEMNQNQQLDITIPIPIPEPMIVATGLGWIFLMLARKRPERKPDPDE